MAPKPTTLEDLLARPICYYCERDFDDEAVLKNHMRKKHLWCPNCRKLLDSAGGVTVHMMQVHKEQFKTIPNALEGREDPSQVEVIGSLGFPEQLKQELHDKIRQKYWQHAAEFKARTGNPLPGSGEVVQDKQHVETPEEIRARAAAHIAKKRAERAAAVAAAANNGGSAATPPSAPNSTTPSADPQSGAAPIVPTNNAMSPSIGYHASSPVNQNFGNGQWSAAAQANPAYPASGHQPWPQTSMPPSHPHMAPTLPHYPPVPITPNAGIISATGQSQSFFSGVHRPSSSHMQTPPNSIGANASKPSSLPTVPAPARQSSLPSVPGLPQRPAFDSPNFSKEDMAKMHSGQQPTPPAFYGGAPPVPFPPTAGPNQFFASPTTPATFPNSAAPAPYAQAPAVQPSQGAHQSMPAELSGTPHQASSVVLGVGTDSNLIAAKTQQQQNMSIPDQVGQLIDSVTNGTASAAPVQTVEQSAKVSDSALSTTTGAPSSRKRASPSDDVEPGPAKKKQRKTVLKMADVVNLSPEEKLAAKRGW